MMVLKYGEKNPLPAVMADRGFSLQGYKTALTGLEPALWESKSHVLPLH